MNDPAHPKRIILVGAGQIGTRHLQGLARSPLDLVIEVVDPIESSRKLAVQRFSEIDTKSGMKQLRCVATLAESSFDDYADLAIIATTAETRRDVVDELLESLTIPFLVLEKVLFQRVADLVEVEALLASARSCAWVNCTRRLYTHAAYLRELFTGDPIKLRASGSFWGLGSNGIHLLDYLAYLSGSSTADHWDLDRLVPTLYDSKRSGFLEFAGQAVFRLQGGHELVVQDDRAGENPFVIEITGHRAQVKLVEGAGLMIVAQQANNWRPEISKIDVPYQSNLTNLVVEELFSRGTCGLTQFGESARLHSIYLSAFLEHMTKTTGIPHDVCPIT